MKKFLSIMSVVTLTVFTFPIFAGGDRDDHGHGKKPHTASSSSSSKAYAEANASASVKTNQKQQQTQSQTLNNDLSVTVNGGSNNGGSATMTANPSITNSIEASKAVPQALIAPNVPGTPPELFPGLQATPINVADFEDHMKLMGSCGAVFSGGKSPIITEDGASKITKVVVNVFSHDGLRDEADAAVGYIGTDELTVECLGTVQVSANPNSDYSADYGTIESDAGIASYKHFKVNASDIAVTSDKKSGKSGKFILMVPVNMVSVIGVKSGGSGKAASGSGSHLNNVTLFGIGVSLGNNDGYAYPSALLGGKFYVFAPMRDGASGTIIKVGNFSNTKTYYNLASGKERR